jgi:hypothetical protein
LSICKEKRPLISSTGGDTRDCINEINCTEGLVFGPAPDFKPYITSFQANLNDTDTVVIAQGPKGAFPGEYVCRTDLDDGASQPRAFAQALLFGPQGALFVPISGNGPDQGAMRRYDLSAKAKDPHTTRLCLRKIENAVVHPKNDSADPPDGQLSNDLQISGTATPIHIDETWYICAVGGRI